VIVVDRMGHGARTQAEWAARQIELIYSESGAKDQESGGPGSSSRVHIKATTPGDAGTSERSSSPARVEVKR
jgi:hypothetical protein